MNSQIEELKNSLILERPRPQNQVKKMIEISDDRTAAEKAEFLVRKLKNEKKLREQRKIMEMDTELYMIHRCGSDKVFTTSLLSSQ